MALKCKHCEFTYIGVHDNCPCCLKRLYQEKPNESALEAKQTNEEIIERIETAMKNKDKLPHIKLKHPPRIFPVPHGLIGSINDCKGVYYLIGGMGIEYLSLSEHLALLAEQAAISEKAKRESDDLLGSKYVQGFNDGKSYRQPYIDEITRLRDKLSEANNEMEWKQRALNTIKLAYDNGTREIEKLHALLDEVERTIVLVVGSQYDFSDDPLDPYKLAREALAKLRAGRKGK